MKIYLLLIFILFSVLLYGQTPSSKIIWNTKIKIKWKDFECEPDTLYPGTALSSCGLGYKILEGPKFGVLIYAYFDKLQSWSKDTSDLYGLNHEQGHFDITEFFARKIRKVFASYKCPDSLKKNWIPLLDKFSTELSRYQDLYDSETEYATNFKKQLFWNRKIKAELDKLAKFAF